MKDGENELAVVNYRGQYEGPAKAPYLSKSLSNISRFKVESSQDRRMIVRSWKLANAICHPEVGSPLYLQRFINEH